MVYTSLYTPWYTPPYIHPGIHPVYTPPYRVHISQYRPPGYISLEFHPGFYTFSHGVGETRPPGLGKRPFSSLE